MFSEEGGAGAGLKEEEEEAVPSVRAKKRGRGEAHHVGEGAT